MLFYTTVWVMTVRRWGLYSWEIIACRGRQEARDLEVDFVIAIWLRLAALAAAGSAGEGQGSKRIVALACFEALGLTFSLFTVKRGQRWGSKEMCTATFMPFMFRFVLVRKVS